MSDPVKTHAEKMLELIEARLENRVLKEHSEYQINGRMMKLLSHTELISLRSKYLVEVERERAKASGSFSHRIYPVL